MKATYEQLTENIENSFLYRRFNLPKFNAPYHFHPELELTFIERSKGTRFIGRQVADFEAGDLVLLGANVPHCWQNTVDPNLIGGNPDTIGKGAEGAQSIVIQFKEDFAGDVFLKLSEMGEIRQLFVKAQAGILIKGTTRDFVADKMYFREKSNPFQN